MHYSPQGSSVHGILQARTLERVAIPFSRDSFQLRDQTWVFHIACGFFTIWATRKGLYLYTMEELMIFLKFPSCHMSGGAQAVVEDIFQLHWCWGWPCEVLGQQIWNSEPKSSEETLHISPCLLGLLGVPMRSLAWVAPGPISVQTWSLPPVANLKLGTIPTI